MTLLQAELLIYYVVVVFTAYSCGVQVRNLQRALSRHHAAQRAAGDPDRLVVTSADLLNEWLRLGSHGGLCITLTWLVVLRWRLISPPQVVTFGVFITGIAMLPALLLAMSWNVRRRDRLLNGPASERANMADVLLPLLAVAIVVAGAAVLDMLGLIDL